MILFKRFDCKGRLSIAVASVPHFRGSVVRISGMNSKIS
jgi:hypothetical protein